MMRTVRRIRGNALDRGTDDRDTLIDRYLGRDDHATHMVWRVGPDSPDRRGIDLALIDTTRRTSIPATGASGTLWHVLWAGRENTASVEIRTDIERHEWPIAPGDTVPVPAGGGLVATGDQLAIAISTPGLDPELAPPAHGTDRFHGHNRETVAFAQGGLRVARWKLTQPLPLADHVASPIVVVALARSVVVQSGSEIEMLTQGEAAMVDPAARPIIAPDGLGYLLMVEPA